MVERRENCLEQMLRTKCSLAKLSNVGERSKVGLGGEKSGVRNVHRANCPVGETFII